MCVLSPFPSPAWVRVAHVLAPSPRPRRALLPHFSSFPDHPPPSSLLTVSPNSIRECVENASQICPIAPLNVGDMYIMTVCAQSFYLRKVHFFLLSECLLKCFALHFKRQHILFLTSEGVIVIKFPFKKKRHFF